MKYFFIQYLKRARGRCLASGWAVACGPSLKSARIGLKAALGWHGVEFPGGWKKAARAPGKVPAHCWPPFHFYRW